MNVARPEANLYILWLGLFLNFVAYTLSVPRELKSADSDHPPCSDSAESLMAAGTAVEIEGEGLGKSREERRAKERKKKGEE
ncbi:hypothetical protein JOC55_001902 [Paenibacillus sacheonensis]|nr:hypothetical protein [Paenibacillus sacheonensis]